MNQLQQVIYNDDLILTTEQLAEFYGTTPQHINQNFANNRSKFIEGKHFYQLAGQTLKEFKNRVENFDLVGKNAKTLTLWTKRGASRHSKMLGTDKAWDMYDTLEENYFNTKQALLPSTPEEKLFLTMDVANRTVKRVDRLEEDFNSLKNNQPLAPGEYNYISRQVSTAVGRYIRAHHLALSNSQRSKLFKDINRGINEVTGIKTRTQLRKKDFETADEYIAEWQPSTATLTVIKQMNGEAEGQTELVGE